MSQRKEFYERFGHFIEKIEPLLPPSPDEIDWSKPAFRWRQKSYFGVELGTLEPIAEVAFVDPKNIQNVERQKEILLSNTDQFVKGLPANNVLLTGARGTGKSSLIRSCLSRFYPEGLRLIEVDKSDLKYLGEITALVRTRPEKFIIFCDDLSFEPGEAAYKALKAILDGSISASSENMIIYATSNRRHLMPEKMQDNLDCGMDETGLIHPAETVEEQMSLSERFGLWLSFYPFNQEEYLRIAEGWTRHFNGPINEEWKVEALQFALQRGSRSGRVAYQFARDWTGRNKLKNDK
ncbi:MAG: ATP-binding protein [Burkholderiales bacterium]|nr:ATP-binding protein [Burkholderiales bacterium]